MGFSETVNAHNEKSSDTKVSALTQFYSPDVSFQLDPVDDAEQQLSILLQYYWSGLHLPLAFFSKTAFSMYRKNGKPNYSEMNTKWNGNERISGEKDAFEHWLLHRDIVINQEQQEKQFIQISDMFFGNLFSVLTEI